MKQLNFDQLLEAGCHFGHLKRKWNPNMAPYIFMERNGIHVIDLYKSVAKLEEAANAIKQIAKSNRKLLFVGTKKQAKELIANAGKKTGMPYVVERWPGGLLTNFATIRKSVKKMINIDKLMEDQSFTNISKRERLQITRERAKLEKNFGSIADLNKIPSALFIVDINKEHIAVAEARKLNIPTFAIVDTNTNPLLIDFPVPANDDAAKSIGLILDYITDAFVEGLDERKAEKDIADQEEEESGVDVVLADDQELEEIVEKKIAVKAEKAIKLDVDDEEVSDSKPAKKIIKKK
jgi:small subunit ribosomal protein S2